MNNEIYRAYIVKYNDEEYRGTTNIHVGYFKSCVNAWNKIGEFIESDNIILSGTHISYCERFNGDIIQYDRYSGTTFMDILDSISKGKISLVKTFVGYDYYFYVEPIKIED